MNDVATRNKLVEDNLRLVPFFAESYCKPGIEKDDLWQAGYLGLMRAADTYNPELGVKFSHYAARSIRNYCMKEVQKSNLVHIPSYLQETVTKMSKHLRSHPEDSSLPTHVLAEAAGLKKPQWAEYIKSIPKQPATFSDEDDCGDSRVPPVDLPQVSEALSTLDRVSELVMRLRTGICPDPSAPLALGT